VTNELPKAASIAARPATSRSVRPCRRSRAAAIGDTGLALGDLRHDDVLPRLALVALANGGNALVTAPLIHSLSFQGLTGIYLVRSRGCALSRRVTHSCT